jgi:hypothetical protein
MQESAPTSFPRFLTYIPESEEIGGAFMINGHDVVSDPDRAVSYLNCLANTWIDLG